MTVSLATRSALRQRSHLTTATSFRVMVGSHVFTLSVARERWMVVTVAAPTLVILAMPRKTFDPYADVNEDLVGFRFKSEDGTLTVTGTPSWSNQWVLCESRDGFLTARQAGLLRSIKPASKRKKG